MPEKPEKPVSKVNKGVHPGVRKVSVCRKVHLPLSEESGSQCYRSSPSKLSSSLRSSRGVPNPALRGRHGPCPWLSTIVRAMNRSCLRKNRSYPLSSSPAVPENATCKHVAVCGVTWAPGAHVTGPDMRASCSPHNPSSRKGCSVAREVLVLFTGGGKPPPVCSMKPALTDKAASSFAVRFSAARAASCPLVFWPRAARRQVGCLQAASLYIAGFRAGSLQRTKDNMSDSSRERLRVNNNNTKPFPVTGRRVASLQAESSAVRGGQDRPFVHRLYALLSAGNNAFHILYN